MERPAHIILLAAGACDALGTVLRPAAVALRGHRILAVGRPEAIASAHRGRDTAIQERPREVVLPALVNAHAHLDLTLLGPRPYGGNFMAWLRDIAQCRRADPRLPRESVAAGLEQSQSAGVGVVGDIAGTAEAAQARLESPEPGQMPGVSFVECFGVGRRQVDGFIELARRLGQLPGAEKLHAEEGALGLQPHAPYSAGAALYAAAGQLAEARGYRLCTHLAESPAELQFVRDAAGPFARLLADLGKWDESVMKPTGLHPVEWLEPELRRGDWLVAHCNYLAQAHIQTLAACRVSVAYCPLASEYFGFPDRGRHPYRELLAHGVNVCLGTDSILCQPPGQPQPLGILPQMRRLYQRDRTDPLTLLRMATVNGLKALGMKHTLASLLPGAPARLIAVEINPQDPADLLMQALAGTTPASVVHWARVERQPFLE